MEQAERLEDDGVAELVRGDARLKPGSDRPLREEGHCCGEQLTCDLVPIRRFARCVVLSEGVPPGAGRDNGHPGWLSHAAIGQPRQRRHALFNGGVDRDVRIAQRCSGDRGGVHRMGDDGPARRYRRHTEASGRVDLFCCGLLAILPVAAEVPGQQDRVDLPAVEQDGSDAVERVDIALRGTGEVDRVGGRGAIGEQRPERGDRR